MITEHAIAMLADFRKYVVKHALALRNGRRCNGHAQHRVIVNVMGVNFGHRNHLLTV